MNAPWMKTGHELLGEQEIAGPTANPAIMKMFEAVGWDPKERGDEEPWCGAYTGYVMVRNGIEPPELAVRATSWKQWGVACKPRRGAVAVVRRTGGHHVALIDRVTASHVYLLGGNQSNAVTVARWPIESIVSTRWPDEQVGNIGPVSDEAVRDAIGHELSHRSQKFKATDLTEKSAGVGAVLVTGVGVVNETVTSAKSTIDILTGFLAQFGFPLVVVVCLGVFGLMQHLKRRQIQDAEKGKYVADEVPT